MKDTQILSAFGKPLKKQLKPEPVALRALVFDACQTGVVLRAVLFMECLLSVIALFDASHWGEWIALLSLLTGGVLPATLIWLVVACSLKKPLAKLPFWGQYVAGVFLGVISGFYSRWMLSLVGIESVSWLACGAAGAFVSALLVAALVLRAKGKTPAATSARLTELQARIRPHFLFNSLNSAIALIREQPAQAETLLEDLSELFRRALVEQGESTSLEDELKLAKHYLAIEKIRFGERLRINWSIDKNANTARLPPLLLQPLVENAIKHGVEPNPHPTLIKISTRRIKNQVVIRVSNTLPLPKYTEKIDSSGHGIALNNVRNRLSLLHDVECSFKAVQKPERYSVTIEIPI